MKIDAKKIRIEFNDSSEDFWEATSESGIEFDEAMRMITRAWREHAASAEPLIKDEKIRKAVRAWAKSCNIERVYLRLHTEEGSTFCVYKFSTDCYSLQIATHDQDPIGGGRAYTIAELCGEEEK